MEIKTFDGYQKEAVALKISLNKFQKIFPNMSDDIIKLIAVTYDGLGLGEAGEVQGKIKKIIRDNGGIIDEESKMGILLEIGDTLWYLASLCENLDTTLEHAATLNIEKLHTRQKNNTLHGNGDYR